MSESLFDQTDIPDIEVEIAADAIHALWQSDRNQQAIRESGHGASFLAMAIVVLEAAANVRGKIAARDDGIRVH